LQTGIAENIIKSHKVLKNSQQQQIQQERQGFSTTETVATQAAFIHNFHKNQSATAISAEMLRFFGGLQNRKVWLYELHLSTIFHKKQSATTILATMLRFLRSPQPESVAA